MKILSMIRNQTRDIRKYFTPNSNTAYLTLIFNTRSQYLANSR